MVKMVNLMLYGFYHYWKKEEEKSLWIVKVLDINPKEIKLSTSIGS